MYLQTSYTYRVGHTVPYGLDRSRVRRIVPSSTSRLSTYPSQEPTGQGVVGSSPQRADRLKSSSAKLNLYRIRKKYTYELLVPIGQDIQCPIAQIGLGQDMQCLAARAVLAPTPPRNLPAREQQAVRPSEQIGQSPAPQNSIYIGFVKNILTNFLYLQGRIYGTSQPKQVQGRTYSAQRHEPSWYEPSQYLPLPRTYRLGSSRQFALAGKQAKVQLRKTQFI